jgi:circadian clock protein KaiB
VQRNGSINGATDWEGLAGRRHRERYVLRLYVTGLTLRSSQAIANLRALCQKYLAGRHDLEVIDLYQQPELAAGQQIIASPTLVKELPLPVRHLIGDLSDEQRVLVGLDLRRRRPS